MPGKSHGPMALLGLVAALRKVSRFLANKPTAASAGPGHHRVIYASHAKCFQDFSLLIPPLCSQWDILECEFSLDEKEVINSVLCIWEDRPGWNKAGKAGTDGGSGEVLDRL